MEVNAAQVRADIAASFQQVAVAHLVERCERAISWVQQDVPQIKHFVVAGGVACNQCLRQALQKAISRTGLEMICPPPVLCTDNGIMIAWAGIERYHPLLCVQENVPTWCKHTFPPS